MARTTKRKEGAAKPKQRKPGRRELRPPSSLAPLGATEIAVAILELCDTAVRYLAVEQRGRTSLAEVDRRVLRGVIDVLARQRHAYAGAGQVGRKVPRLSPAMQMLGWARWALNALCEYAARQPASDSRDFRLAAEMVRWLPNEVTLEHAEEAIRTLKRQAAERADLEAGVPADWLLATSKASTDRGGIVIAAGELLEETLLTSGVRLDASTSGSSTAEYAKKVQLQIEAQVARLVSPFERLAYLMTVLGVPLEDVPWATWQVSKIIAGETLVGATPFTNENLFRGKPPFFHTAIGKIRSPTAYYPPEPEMRRRTRDVVRRGLLTAGFSEHELEAADRIVNSALPGPTKWSGRDVDTTWWKVPAVEDPWAERE